MKQPFEQIVVEHGETVLRVCRVVVGVVDADDAWSETFLSALRAYPDLPADANVQAWLVTIAHRKAIDIMRSRARQGISVDDAPELPSTRDLPGSVDLDLWDAVSVASDQTATNRRLSLSRRYAVRGYRGPDWRHRGGCPAICRRWHQGAPADIS